MITKNIFKKLIFVILCFLMVLCVVGCDACFTKFIFTFMLYDGIEYNGVIYHHIVGVQQPSQGVGEYNIPVYIVDNNKTRYDYVFYAAGIEGDSDNNYLIFDSGVVCVRSDAFPPLPTTSSSENNSISSSDVTSAN